MRSRARESFALLPPRVGALLRVAKLRAEFLGELVREETVIEEKSLCHEHLMPVVYVTSQSRETSPARSRARAAATCRRDAPAGGVHARATHRLAAVLLRRARDEARRRGRGHRGARDFDPGAGRPHPTRAFALLASPSPLAETGHGRGRRQRARGLRACSSTGGQRSPLLPTHEWPRGAREHQCGRWATGLHADTPPIAAPADPSPVLGEERPLGAREARGRWSAIGCRRSTRVGTRVEGGGACSIVWPSRSSP